MHKIIITKSSSPSLMVIAVTLGLVASLVINNISRLLHVWEGLWAYAVALVFFIVSGWLLAYASPINLKFKDITKYVGIFCFAIAPGVFIDATIDFFMRHYDRNLFPFEIIMWWIFAPLPLLSGILIGRNLFEFKIKNENP